MVRTQDSGVFLGWAELGGAGIAGRHLARRQPQGPLAGVVLGEDGEHALHRAQDGAMQNDRLLQRLVLRAVLEVKPARGRNQLSTIVGASQHACSHQTQ